jgi:hypothetical protein
VTAHPVTTPTPLLLAHAPWRQSTWRLLIVRSRLLSSCVSLPPLPFLCCSCFVARSRPTSVYAPLGFERPAEPCAGGGEEREKGRACEEGTAKRGHREMTAPRRERCEKRS